MRAVTAPAREIAGRVYDSAGAPLAGLEVDTVPRWMPVDEDPTALAGQRRLGPPGVREATGDDGGFLLDGLALHPYQVRVSAKGFTPWEATHSPSDGFLEIVLASGVQLTGRVLDKEGRGIDGAEVCLWDRIRPRARTTTDDQGSYRLTGLAPDPSATLGSSAPGYAIHVVHPLRIREDRPNEVTIRLEPERVLAGRVVNSEGSGVANARVEIEGDRVVHRAGSRNLPWERVLERNATRTDAAGAFLLDRLYAGTFSVTATHPDDPWQKAIATAASGAEDLVLTLEPDTAWAVKIVGRVTDAATGAPVPSFQITGVFLPLDGMQGVPSQSVDDEDGCYELRGLSPGRIRLWFAADGYAQEDVPKREYAVGEHRLDVALAQARDLAVRLVDRNHVPAADAHLWIQGPGKKRLMYKVEGQKHSGSPRLDAYGEKRFHGLPAGPITLTFSVPGAPRLEVDLDLTLPLEGVQEFVLDAELPRTLKLALLSASPGATGGPIVEVTSQHRWNVLASGETDVGPLSAPRFSLEVWDAAGEVCATASGTRWYAEGGWTLAWSDGDRQVERDSPGSSPYLRLVVPEGALDIDVKAPGHRPFQVLLTPEELVPTCTSTRMWGLILEREN